MRHFESKPKAKKFRNEKQPGGKIFKKLKGHKNRVKKPYVVGSYFEWLNLY